MGVVDEEADGLPASHPALGSDVEGDGSWGLEAEFERLVREVEPRLRRALVAAYGADRGREATAEALAFAWQERERLAGMSNVAGYLFRVGQSKTRRWASRPVPFETRWVAERDYEPKLAGALARLSKRQRLAVVLVHGFGWTPTEVAAVTGLKRNSVNNHLERGLRRLRSELGVTDA